MHRPLRAVLALALLVALLYPFATPLLTGHDTRAEDMDIVEGMQLAVLHYNTSTRLLAEGSEPGAGVAIEAMELAVYLSSMREDLKAQGGLLGTIYQALGEYSRLAYTASLVYNASAMNSRLMEEILEVISLLADCRVNESLDAWGSIEGNVSRLLSTLEAALANASDVSPRNMLSEDHRIVYAEGLTRIQGLYTDLSLLAQIMERVESLEDPEDACMQGGLIANIEAAQMQGSGSPYSYEIYSLILKLQGSGGTGATETGIGAQGEGDSSSTGVGAGWGEPASDD